MIVAQQAFFAGMDLEGRKKVRGKEKEDGVVVKSPEKAKGKGKSAGQRQMDRLLHGKKKRCKGLLLHGWFEIFLVLVYMEFRSKS